MYDILAITIYLEACPFEISLIFVHFGPFVHPVVPYDPAVVLSGPLSLIIGDIGA